MFTGLKFVASWLSSWAGVPAGMFGPSLSIGAGLGADVAWLFDSPHTAALIALADEVINIEAEVAPHKLPPPTLISGLVVFLAPLFLLLGSLAVTSLASAIALAASALVTMAAVWIAGLRIPNPRVLLPGVIGVVSIGDLVKNIIELQGNQIKFLETYIKGHGS